MLADGELAAWLRLLCTPEIGRGKARRLLAAFGSAEAIFHVDGEARRGVLGPAAAPLDEVPAVLAAQVEATRQWLQAEASRDIVVLGDSRYPESLLQTPDPPLLMFVQGRAELLCAPSIAVVGSRHPSPQGKDNARSFAKSFSEAGWCVVSGLALGIDGAAHEGAIDGRGGTLAVVGTGLDRVYPPQHRALAHRIAQKGLLVSEYPLGTPPIPHNFPQRNRMIAGLSRGTLVAEAALQSGSLITARLAVEMGREVFAIPGSIHLPQAQGCHALIKQGAQLVEGPEEVLESLGTLSAGTTGSATPSAADGTTSAAEVEREDEVLACLGQDPATLDSLAARTGLPLPVLGARLLELELEGRIARLPGGLFQRRSAA